VTGAEAPGSQRRAIVNAMSVDVEDYFHVSVFDNVVPRSQWARMPSRVASNTARLLDLFDEHGVRGTFFVLGAVAEQHPHVVRSIAERGHEVASHGYGHQLVYTQTVPDFRDDVTRAKRLLEDIVGVAVSGYRAPSFSVTTKSLWALDVLMEQGYRYDASIFPIRHDRYGIPASPRHPYAIERNGRALKEVPGSTVRLGPLNLPVAGGGYFRLLPYAWTHWGVAHLNFREQRPAVFYIHPWEIDPGQPRLPAGWLGRFRHYRNLDKVETRLRRLLADFQFDTIASLLAVDVPVGSPVQPMPAPLLSSS
jgi:polysaccharide deacetylase family protein (PEP-CTERM system associated)